jgi:hypothetical protein
MRPSPKDARFEDAPCGEIIVAVASDETGRRQAIHGQDDDAARRWEENQHRNRPSPTGNLQ